MVDGLRKLKPEDTVPVHIESQWWYDAENDAREQRRFNDQPDWLASPGDPQTKVFEGCLAEYVFARGFLRIPFDRIGDKGGAAREPDVTFSGFGFEVKCRPFRNREHLNAVSDKCNFGGNGWVPDHACGDYIVFVRFEWDKKDRAWIDGYVSRTEALKYPRRGNTAGASGEVRHQVPFEDFHPIRELLPEQTVRAIERWRNGKA